MATNYTIADTIDQYKPIYFQYGLFSDQSTVALSFISSVLCILPFNTKSGNKHAEEYFIDGANQELEKMSRFLLDHKEITIVMMISKSPCFNCREELEVFFHWWSRRGLQISYVLRIANLYYGDGSRITNVIINNLATWLRHLKVNNIVHQVSIQPISVTEELNTYSPRIRDEKKWEETIQKRQKKDADIRRHVCAINTAIHSGNPLPVESRYMYTSLTEFSNDRSLNANGKRLFYRSCPQPPTQAAEVALGQIEVHAVNTMGTTKSKILRHIKIADPKGCRQCCVPTTLVLEKITSFPKCWNLTEISLTLMITHCPCGKCFQDIYNRLILMAPPDQVIKRHLTLRLRIANFCEPDAAVTEIAEWMVELEKINFSIHLEAIPVLEELPSQIVHRPPHIGREYWEQVKVERRSNDLTSQQIVRQINSEKRRIQQLMVVDPTVSDLTTYMRKLVLRNKIWKKCLQPHTTN